MINHPKIMKQMLRPHPNLHLEDMVFSYETGQDNEEDPPRTQLGL